MGKQILVKELNADYSTHLPKVTLDFKRLFAILDYLDTPAKQPKAALLPKTLLDGTRGNYRHGANISTLDEASWRLFQKALDSLLC